MPSMRSGRGTALVSQNTDEGLSGGGRVTDRNPSYPAPKFVISGWSMYEYTSTEYLGLYHTHFRCLETSKRPHDARR